MVIIAATMVVSGCIVGGSVTDAIMVVAATTTKFADQLFSARLVGVIFLHRREPSVVIEPCYIIQII